jgi:hypothetical protein
MRTVVFVAPFFLATTLRFIKAAATLPGVRLGLISQDPVEKLPGDIRARLAAHQRVDDAIDPVSILDGLEALDRQIGPAERLLGTLEELQVPLGEVRDRLGIPGMGSEAGRNFRDKARMKGVLRDAGLPTARHRLAGSADDALAFARSSGFPLVVKPPAGSGARSTFRIENEEELRASLQALPPTPANPTLLEEFVVGEEYSFDSILLDGKLVWYSINHYLPTPLEVLREPWIQWCVVLPREVNHPRYERIREVAERALPILGMRTGLSHMEWFRRPDDSVAVSEVGARPPGAQFTTLISYAHDFDLYAAWARLMVFDEFQPRPRPYAAGAAYLRGQGKGRVRGVRGLSEIARQLGDLVVESRLPKPGQPPSGSYEGEGYVIVRHADTSVVEAALQQIVRSVRVELA